MILSTINAQVKERDSNIELLRIVCMLLILIHHFIIHVFYPDLSFHNGVINGYRIACILINGFAYVGVNCFILISGYYGIRGKVKSLFNLYCICVFYAILTTLMKGCVADMHLNKSLLYSIFLPFSHSEWWFIQCYAALFLISPVLNKAVQHLDQKEFLCSILSLTVLNIYLGYYWHLHNIDGYNLVQFIFVYLIGAYLRRFPLKCLCGNHSTLLYIICAATWSLITILSIKWRVPHWISFYYNNPLVILAAIGLFVRMTNLQLRSRSINLIASSVLAAYLIQDIPGGLVYSLSASFDNKFIVPINNDTIKIISMMVFVLFGSILILFSSFIIDRIRLTMMKPIWSVYNLIKKALRKDKSHQIRVW